jgi:uncharacterized membrane protein HdeD (DUF308 family)
VRRRRGGCRPAGRGWTGSALCCAGLFEIVFGISHAETAGWTAALTLGSLAMGVVLLARFVAQALVVRGNRLVRA